VKLLITTGIFPPDIGGPATYVPTMARALASRGCHITIVTLADKPAGEENWGPGILLVRMPRLRARFRRTAGLLLRLCRLGKTVDVFFSAGLPLESILAAIWLGKPCVMRIGGDLAWEKADRERNHTDDLDSFQGRRQGFTVEVYRYLQSWAVRRGSWVITPSDYLKRIVMDWGISGDRIQVIRNPVDLFDLSGEPLPLGPREIPPKDRFRIITCGRLVPLKRLGPVIRAVSRLPEVELVVVGDGPERARLEALSQSTGARTHFVGALPRCQALTLLGSADIAIINSISEGFPNFVLEAMALGVPVIASSAGGILEIVRDRETGLLVRNGTENQILDAIRQLIADAALRRRIVQEAKTLVSKFEVGRAADETWAILRQAARNHGSLSGETDL
jgi:glycosyltransferase involved in cell wall biosynthesis